MTSRGTPNQRIASFAINVETAATRSARSRLSLMKRLNEAIVLKRCRPGIVREVKS
jgi:hypothetical protein